LLVHAGPILAQDWRDYQTPRGGDMARLPPYCQYTQNFRNSVPEPTRSQQVEHWANLLGPSFDGLHHYCWGLLATFRSTDSRFSAEARRALLARSVDEFDYVLRNPREGLVVLPEIRTKKGQSLAQLKRAAEAIGEFQLAIQLKPDYWPPYAYLSDLYRDMGDRARAREVLEDGLKNVPDAQALLSRRSALQAGQSGAKAK
jgi:tetratricopeptide (TPR) repeat protein